jgi:hypothetical protein
MRKISVLLLALCVSALASSMSNKPLEASIVVYGADMAFVHEKYTVSLDQGMHPLIYQDMRSGIIATSMHLEPPKDAMLVSQRFIDNIPTLNKLLRANIGKQVIYSKHQVTLLAVSGSSALVKASSGDIFSVKTADLHFRSLPPLLSSKPRLIWDINSTKQIKGKISVDYLVRNISWKSEYFLHLVKDKAELTGWIAIKNSTDRSYKNSTVSVIAGDVATGALPRKKVFYARALGAQAVTAAPLQGYHIYTLPMKVDIAGEAATWVKFLHKQNFKSSTKYIAILKDPNSLRQTIVSPVDQYVSFQNRDLVLPAGTMRVYSRYKNEMLFVGQSQIGQTPKNQTLKINIGKAFDLHISQSVVKRSSLKNLIDEEILYKVQNAGDESKTIMLKIPFIKGKYLHIITAKKYLLQGGYAVFHIKVKAGDTQSFHVRFKGKR